MRLLQHRRRQTKILPNIGRLFIPSSLIIRMFHNEHNPPHFHAEYQGQRGLFNFNGEMLKGNIKSKTARKLIKQWANLHPEELRSNWDKAVQGKQIDRIEPLN